jgi:hypothetical protein
MLALVLVLWGTVAFQAGYQFKEERISRKVAEELNRRESVRKYRYWLDNGKDEQ